MTFERVVLALTLAVIALVIFVPLLTPPPPTREDAFLECVRALDANRMLTGKEVVAFVETCRERAARTP